MKATKNKVMRSMRVLVFGVSGVYCLFCASCQYDLAAVPLLFFGAGFIIVTLGQIGQGVDAFMYRRKLAAQARRKNTWRRP